VAYRVGPSGRRGSAPKIDLLWEPILSRRYRISTKLA